MSNKIDHPLKKGTKVKYASPRCPCTGKRFVVVTGTIQGVTLKGNNGNISYRIAGDKHRIPAKAIMEVVK